MIVVHPNGSFCQSNDYYVTDCWVNWPEGWQPPGGKLVECPSCRELGVEPQVGMLGSVLRSAGFEVVEDDERVTVTLPMNRRSPQ